MAETRVTYYRVRYDLDWGSRFSRENIEIIFASKPRDDQILAALKSKGVHTIEEHRLDITRLKFGVPHMVRIAHD